MSVPVLPMSNNTMMPCDAGMIRRATMSASNSLDAVSHGLTFWADTLEAYRCRGPCLP